MKLSTKSRYGLNAMYHLATSNNNGVVSLKELSVKTQVTQPYLEKVMGILRKGKLVTTTRGVMGGYKLAKSPSEITIGEILRILEKDLIFSDCVNSQKCTNRSCPNKNIFNLIYVKLNNVLDEITLQQMIDNQGECYE